jgi:small-conductance mechanosensitive channel
MSLSNRRSRMERGNVAMDELNEPLAVWLNTGIGWGIARALLLFAVGFVLARLAERIAARVLTDSLSAHGAQVARRLIFYAILSIFIAMALRELGFQLHVLLGAAGVLSVALGFASQTAASNLISGFFLLIERPFAVGQIIKVGATSGEVISIDLLSTTMRTFDNLAVRIPNEQLMKSEITNMTRFPIRRYDLQVGVAYKEDLSRVQKVLEDVADRNALCLEEPKPLLILQGFGESSLDIQFSIWGLRENYLALRNSIQIEIKEAFDREGIEIPFPHRTLYAGSETDPLPVELVEPAGERT